MTITADNIGENEPQKVKNDIREHLFPNSSARSPCPADKFVSAASL